MRVRDVNTLLFMTENNDLRRDLETLRAFSRSFSDTPFPKQVVFETTAHCNLKCPMCPQPTMLRTMGRMELALFRKVIDEIAEWGAPNLEIWFAVHGEPLLLGTGLKDYIDYAWEKTHAKLCLNTNGIPMNEKHAEWLVRSPLDKVIVSIDGHSAETYEAARVGAKYSHIKENTLRFLKLLAVQPEPKPKAVVQMVLMPNNVHERDAFRDYWTSQGATVKIKPYLEWAGACKTDKPLTLPPERVTCQWVMSSIHVLWDGRVPQCGPDTECEELQGNMNTDKLLDIWRERHRVARLRHLEQRWGDLPPICRRCKDWAAGPAEWMNDGLR